MTVTMTETTTTTKKMKMKKDLYYYSTTMVSMMLTWGMLFEHSPHRENPPALNRCCGRKIDRNNIGWGWVDIVVR